MIVNGVAAEDYSPVDARGDFETVMRNLVGDFRYAVGQYIAWYKNEPEGSPTLTAHNQFSPQHEYLIPMSQTYIAAKAAYRPTYWSNGARRRSSITRTAVPSSAPFRWRRAWSSRTRLRPFTATNRSPASSARSAASSRKPPARRACR
jgi:hypothetical protein